MCCVPPPLKEEEKVRDHCTWFAICFVRFSLDHSRSMALQHKSWQRSKRKNEASLWKQFQEGVAKYAALLGCGGHSGCQVRVLSKNVCIPNDHYATCSSFRNNTCVSVQFEHTLRLFFTYTKRFGVSNFRNGQWHLWNCTISGCVWPGSPPHSRCTSTSVFSCLHSRVSILVYVQWSHSCSLLDAKSSSKSHCEGCSPVCVPWSSPADNHFSFLGLFVRNYWRCGCNLPLPWDSGFYVCMENLPSAPTADSGSLVLFLYRKSKGRSSVDKWKRIFRIHREFVKREWLHSTLYKKSVHPKQQSIGLAHVPRENARSETIGVTFIVAPSRNLKETRGDKEWWRRPTNAPTSRPSTNSNLNKISP